VAHYPQQHSLNNNCQKHREQRPLVKKCAYNKAAIHASA